MAAITPSVDAISAYDLLQLAGTNCRGQNKLALIAPGLYAPVPQVCSEVITVPNGSLIALEPDSTRLIPRGDNLFILDPRITYGWHWVAEEGRRYLRDLVRHYYPLDSIPFADATGQIDVPVEAWKFYLDDQVANNLMNHLAVPRNSWEALSHARGAGNYIKRLYSFISLIRARTLRKPTLIRCPEDSPTWRQHALYCQASIRPRIADSVHAHELSPDVAIELDEAQALLRQANERAEVAERKLRDLELKSDEVRDSNEELRNAVVLGKSYEIEARVAKQALAKTLQRYRDEKDWSYALENDSFGNWVVSPIPSPKPRHDSSVYHSVFGCDDCNSSDDTDSSMTDSSDSF